MRSKTASNGRALIIANDLIPAGGGRDIGLGGRGFRRD